MSRYTNLGTRVVSLDTRDYARWGIIMSVKIGHKMQNPNFYQYPLRID